MRGIPRARRRLIRCRNCKRIGLPYKTWLRQPSCFPCTDLSLLRLFGNPCDTRSYIHFIHRIRRHTNSFAKLQADAFCRRHPSMRITTLRFHWVVPDKLVDREYLHAHKGSWRDLWGWVSLNAASKAVLLSLTVPESSFPVGHETFFIVAQTSCQQTNSMDLLRSKFPGIKEIRTSMKGNAAFFDCSKAERMLGWKEEGFPSC